MTWLCLPYTRERSDARVKVGLCCSVRDGQFCCTNKVSDEIRASGCGICQECCDRERDLEGEIDGLVALANDHQRDE